MKKNSKGESVKNREAMMLSIFSAVPVGIGLLSNRVFNWASEKLCKMLGYSKEERAGQSARILYPDDEEYERVGREIYERIREKGIGSIETRWKHRDGSIMDIFVSGAALNKEDITKGIVFSAENITERKKAEKKVVDLARFPAENPFPVLRVSEDGVILYANEGSSALLHAWDQQKERIQSREWLEVVRENYQSYQKLQI